MDRLRFVEIIRCCPPDRVAQSEKPHKGKLLDAYPISWGDAYLYQGTFATHPRFAGRFGHTSLVVWEQPHHPGQPFEIETLNSRYTIVPKSSSVAQEGSKPAE